MFIRYLPLTLVGVYLILASLTSSCKKDDDKPDEIKPPAETTSYLRFNHEVDGTAVVYDTLQYTNTFGNTFSIETIRYFISNVEFAKINGETIVVDEAIYIDPRKPGYESKTYTSAMQNGTYTEMRFTFGLDSAMNQTGAFPNFPETAMEWPMMMGGGYHYMKLEGKYLDDDSYNHFNFHTGPLGGHKNYFQVVIPIDLSIVDGSFDLTLTMEIQNWFDNPNTFDLTAIYGGMMGSQEKQEMVKANGHDVFHVK